jgi:hypothetical protein
MQRVAPVEGSPPPIARALKSKLMGCRIDVRFDLAASHPAHPLVVPAPLNASRVSPEMNEAAAKLRETAARWRLLAQLLTDESRHGRLFFRWQVNSKCVRLRWKWSKIDPRRTLGDNFSPPCSPHRQLARSTNRPRVPSSLSLAMATNASCKEGAHPCITVRLTDDR